jgi:hypothetical protein
MDTAKYFYLNILVKVTEQLTSPVSEIGNNSFLSAPFPSKSYSIFGQVGVK